MKSSDPKFTAARAFIRSLNILLKYARLYSFNHTRTAEQFETAWNELHAAIPVTNETGLLLSASGSQLLLDGAPIDATPAERSFAQLLSTAGLASLQFTSRVTKDDLERLVRAFPTHNTKPAALAQQLKAALAGVTGLRINEVRYVAEDASMPESRIPGLLTAQTLGSDAGSMKDWLRDPQKLLQLIAASEGSRSGSGAGPGLGPRGRSGSGQGGGPGLGSVGGTGGGTGASGSGIAGSAGVLATGGVGIGVAGAGEAIESGGEAYSGAKPDGEWLNSGFGAEEGLVSSAFIPGASDIGEGEMPGSAARVIGAGVASGGVTGNGRGAGSGGEPGSGQLVGSGSGTGAGGAGSGGTSPWSSKDEDILGILKLLTHLGHAVTAEGGSVQPGPFQEELAKIPAHSQETLRQALAAVAAQVPATNSNDPMLLRLAEHLAIRFALERYERGEVKVNAVRNMINRMSQEIEGLRKVLGVHEEKLADAGIVVESSADMLDRQFWAAVPETGKHAVLSSTEAWCIPARNLKQYVEELLARGDEKRALAILQNYASCVQSPEAEARRRTAIGLADLADVYATMEGRPLLPAIQMTGAQLTLERDTNLDGLIGAAFVRMAQEAGARSMLPAMLQALDSLSAIENHRLVLAQALHPRLGFDKRMPEYLDQALRADRIPDGLEKLLRRLPRAAAENMVVRFNRVWNRVEMQRLVELAKAVDGEFTTTLRDTLRMGAPNEAAETVGLLSHLDPPAIERWVPERLHEWPRNAQDRMLRILSMSGSEVRGRLLVSMLRGLDPLLLPMAIDEIGLSGDSSCVQPIMHLAEEAPSRTGGAFVRLKAVEALGRLNAQPALELLRSIADARHMFHWTNHFELRLAAVQSLGKIDPAWTNDFLPRSGFSAADLALAPLDPQANAKYLRRRRYPRMRLKEPMAAMVTAGPDSYRLKIRGLSLSGGIAVGENHLQPGTLVSMKVGTGLRPIRAQVLMRDARAHGLGFEFADMDLDERTRLRKLLLENNSSTAPNEQEVLTGAKA